MLAGATSVFTAHTLPRSMKQVRKTLDAASHPALLLVDGVSSIGALDFQFDQWRVDVAVTGSQKALSLPTGLGLVCASDKVGTGGLRRVARVTPPHSLASSLLACPPAAGTGGRQDCAAAARVL